jgi:hypothetical protein
MKEYKIYKIVDQDNKIVYIGSTTISLSQRKAIHNYQNKISGINYCKIQLIEKTNDKTREDFWISYFRSTGCSLLNKNKATRNKLDDKLYYKNYHLENKEHRLNNVKIWRENNSEKVKNYLEINKDKIQEYQQAYQKEYYKNKR